MGEPLEEKGKQTLVAPKLGYIESTLRSNKLGSDSYNSKRHTIRELKLLKGYGGSNTQRAADVDRYKTRVGFGAKGSYTPHKVRTSLT